MTETLADVDIEKRGREELVLRFFAAKNGVDSYHGHVADWLDNYMEAVLLHPAQFSFADEELGFGSVFDDVDRILGDMAFCKIKDNKPIGGLAPAHYEAIVVAFSQESSDIKAKNQEQLRERLVQARQSAEFRSNVGAGANNRTKLRGRINSIRNAIKSA